MDLDPDGAEMIGIDPGPIKSAMVSWTGKEITQKVILPNDQLLTMIRCWSEQSMRLKLVIEEVRSYGMAVGMEIFTTIRWSGRFEEAFYPGEVIFLPRLDVKLHLCHDSRAKDTNIRHALIDRFGPQGTKKFPGLTYGLSKDMWSAFAIAVTAWDRLYGELNPSDKVQQD